MANNKSDVHVEIKEETITKGKETLTMPKPMEVSEKIEKTTVTTETGKQPVPTGTQAPSGTQVSSGTQAQAGKAPISPSLPENELPPVIDLSKGDETGASGRSTKSSSGEEGAGEDEEKTGEDETGDKKTDEEKAKEGEEKKEGEEGTDKEKPEGEEETPNEKNPETPENTPTDPSEKPGPEGDQSEVSPSIKNEDLKNKKQPRQKTTGADVKGKYGDLKNAWQNRKNPGEAGKEAAKAALKKAAKELVKKAAQWALDAIIGFIGWPAALIILAICLVFILIFAGLSCTSLGGIPGKTYPTPSGKNDPNIKALITKSTTPSKSVSGDDIKGQTGLKLTDEDKKFIEDGKADKRLLALLKYLSDKHSQLTISSIINGFNDPKGIDRENIDKASLNGGSAHAEGMAADIKTTDFVYKVDRPSGSCQRMVASICGPPGTPSNAFCLSIAKMLKIGNLAYYSDKNIPDSTTPTDTNTSLDSALDQAKIDAQKTILENVQQTIDQTQGQYTDFTNKLTQSNDTLVNFRSQNLSNLNSDQRNQLNAQIDKVQNAINQVNDISSQINGYKDQVNDYRSKIDKLQNNLEKVKSTLAKVQEFNNALGANKDPDLDKTINSIANTANQVVSNLDTIDNQLGSINNVLTDTTSTIASQIQGAQTIIGQDQGDMNSYLNNLNSLNITIDAGNVPILFSAFAGGKQALDGFIQKIEQLATSFVDKTVEQIVNEIKTTIKDQVQQVVDDQVSQVLDEFGLGGFGKNTLLLLPCVGYVVPGTTTLGVDGAISDFTNSKLVTEINSGINSAVSIVNSANDQLAQVSQSISGVQNTITSFTNQITQLENSANQFAQNAGGTYLDPVNQALDAAQSTSNQNLDALFKVPAQSQTDDQVCKSAQSSEDPNCTSNISDQQQSQQQTITQNQTNIQQSKDNLLNIKNRLQTVKTTLENTLKQQGSKLNQSQQTQVQQQIQKVQDTISQVDTWVAKIDAYNTQIDDVNSTISDAQQSLSSISEDLSGVQDTVNNISGSIDGWIAKLIPSGLRAYGVLPNTKYKDQKYSEAVQIQLKWQDDPPDSKYINGESDDKGILNALIFATVYRPEAQRKVHELLAESLQAPSDLGNKNYYKVTQLITFSQERDVTPFGDALDKLYGKSRPGNYGLFSMLEAWGQIHIGY